MPNQLHLPGALWGHQRHAVETVNQYLEARRKDGRAALITMPTGTGKTGVIASCVTFLASLSGHRLVLTPWDALVRQLIEDVDLRFWERLGIVRPAQLPQVKRLPPSSSLDKIVHAGEPTVFVATIAAISVMATYCREHDRNISEVFSDFDFVIVDEGHYEPAHRWSVAIRSLNLPTVLLTATPYRNDEKFFLVGDEWRYRFTHHEAVDERLLRTPSFQVVKEDAAGPFAAGVVSLVDERFAGNSPVRVIVRCESAQRIIEIVRALESHGRSAIGVHHTFPPGDANLRRHVPDVDSVDAQFWVHQNKMIEGIDDPRFKVIAFYDSLRNDRAIIQQIGRVLRNPGRKKADMTAYVVGRGDRDLARRWDGYLRFDQQDEAEAVATLPALVDRVLASQPEAFYYQGGYRVRIDLTEDGVWREFAFPLRTRAFRAADEDTPGIEAIATSMSDEWEEIDRTVFPAQYPDEATAVVPFVTAENSPLLRTGTFIEPEFGYTVLRLTGDLLFLYDARGRAPRIVLDNFRPLKPTELARLFPSGASSLTSVSLLNTDIGRQAARSRQLRAAAIDELAPDLSDYGYVCTIAEGYTEIADSQFRRYLGLSRARVTDYRRTERDYAEYSDWLDEIARSLQGEAKPVATFTRYAKYAPTPERPDPVHVLLDVDVSAFEQQGGDTRTPLDLEDTAYDVTDGVLIIIANGDRHDAKLEWNQRMKRYDLEAPTLQAEAFTERDGDHPELIAFINEAQAMRVVPANRTEIYSHGHFFEPVVPVSRAGGFRLLDVLVAVDGLATTSSEKGHAIVDDDWEPTSLFGMISALAPDSARQAPAQMADLLPASDLLLCTDMGTEVADFIATEPGRVVFIHGKASATLRRRSASALHDVASQAIKNLPYLQPLSETAPRGKHWTTQWSSPGVHGTATRQRVGSFTTTADMWKHIRAVISNPRAEREVWLVLGQSLSVEALKADTRRRPPPAEALQVYSLLQTTWGAVSQLGARLRVFCSP
jgi:hypothetical protein